MYFHFSWLNHVLAEGEAEVPVPFPEVNSRPAINFSFPGFKKRDNRPSNGFKFIEMLIQNEAYAIQLRCTFTQLKMTSLVWLKTGGENDASSYMICPLKKTSACMFNQECELLM